MQSDSQIRMGASYTNSVAWNSRKTQENASVNQIRLDFLLPVILGFFPSLFLSPPLSSPLFSGIKSCLLYHSLSLLLPLHCPLIEILPSFPSLSLLFPLHCSLVLILAFPLHCSLILILVFHLSPPSSAFSPHANSCLLYFTNTITKAYVR